MAFGERLQELRRARGMTQEDFAAQLKVSRQAVSKWESCRGYPELEKIIYICNRYGVTMNDLFCEEVPLGGQETPAAPERMESRTLKTALGDFVSNLSPANKWAGVGGLAAVTALVALCMLYLKGGGDSEMTALWIAAIVVFGVVEAVTAGLVSIWFVPGAVAGLIAAMAGAGLLIQLVLFLAVSVYGHFVIQPAMDPALGIVRWLFAILAVGGIVASIVLARRGEGSDKGAFLAQSVSAFCLVGLLAASMFPNLVVASAGSVGPSITLMSAASSELSLMWMTIITCVGLPLVLVYHVIIYRTFRGRIEDDDLAHY